MKYLRLLLVIIIVLSAAAKSYAIKPNEYKKNSDQDRSKYVSVKCPYSDQDNIDFAQCLAEFRLSYAHGISTTFGRDILTYFEGEFGGISKPKKVGYQELSKLLDSVGKQIDSLKFLLSEYEETSCSSEELESGSDSEDDVVPYSTWESFGFLPQEDTHDSSSDNESEFDGDELMSYSVVSSQLAELTEVQASLQRRHADMNAIINSRMKQRNILNHFINHPNPKFNTSSPEGNARVRALLKDIYCIE